MFRLIKFKAYYLSSILWDLTHLILRFISADWRKNCWENRWSGFTCCRYGADFFVNTGVKKPDVLLVSFCDHVRSPIYINNDRCRDKNRQVCSAGIIDRKSVV